MDKNSLKYKIKAFNLSGSDYDRSDNIKLIDIFLKKSPLSEIEKFNEMVDFYLEYKGDVSDLNKNFFETLLYEYLIPSIPRYKENRDYIDKISKVFKKGIEDNLTSSTMIIPSIVKSEFNVYFYMDFEPPNKSFGLFDSRYGFGDIFRYIQRNELWDESYVKRFFIYVFSNEKMVNFLSALIIDSFKDMGKTLQRFFAYKTKLFLPQGNNQIEYGTVLNILNSDSDIEDIVKKQIIKVFTDLKYEIFTKEDIYLNFYPFLNDQNLKLVFGNEMKFYKNLKKIIDEEGLIHFIEHFGSDVGWHVRKSKLEKDKLSKLFQLYPSILEELDTETTDVLAEIKYGGNSEYLPDEIKNYIKLLTRVETTFDGDDLEGLFYDGRDENHGFYVKHYVDETLWDETNGWDYSVNKDDIDRSYWDDIDNVNLERIKNLVQKRYPEVDVDDEDTLKEAALDDDDILTSLRIAAENGQRSGDEGKLIGDIQEAFNDLFVSWDMPGDGKVHAVIDISDFDEDEIRNTYNDCQWSISCIWLEFMRNRDKISLGNYYYGIQGDFDKSTFNDYISDDLPKD